MEQTAEPLTQSTEPKKTVSITLQVEEYMLHLVKGILPRIRGVVSFE